jgi:hypothetical protein
MAVTVDGRTDIEKLTELLSEPEQQHLEFKESVDLSENEGKIKFVKDVVSMSNRHPGGYILIGVDDNGKPVTPQGTFDQKTRELFDGARLNDLIRKYTEGPVHVTSQFHTVSDNEIIIIYAHHNESGLPVPMSALGQYEKNGKNVQLFRTGDICIRDGAQNAPLRWSHWNELLREHDQRIRDDARKDIESLVAEVAKSLRNPDGRSNVPLSIDMTDDTFVEALLTNIELSGDTRIRYFLSQLSGFAADEERYIEALNKATIIAVQALFLGETEIVDLTIKRLFDTYKQLNPRNPSKQLEIIVRCYIIGAAAVRCEAWSTISNLVLHSYPPKIDAFTYIYTSWIRHGQVEASRAHLFPADDRGSLMIPPARLLMVEHPVMRPDVPDTVSTNAEVILESDTILNSLCQFDILYCIIVAADETHDGDAYPASSAFKQDRTYPILTRLIEDEEMRHELFPGRSDFQVAAALNEAIRTAKRQSLEFNNGWWWSDHPNVRSFINEHQSE